MRVEFETDYRDFADAVWLASGAEAAFWNNLLNYFCLYAIVAALGSLPVLMFAPHFVFAVMNFGLILAVCAYFFRPPSRRQFADQYKSIYGTRPFNYTVELEETGVNVRDELSGSLISWKRVRQISETEDDLFLVFRHKSGLKIPKAAFAGAAQTGEFKAFAISRITMAEGALSG